jgi:hypothetical protein
MIHSELEYFDKAYEIQVLPHPKAPGIAHVPPYTEGNNESNTLYPVSSGVLPANLSATGLAYLTGLISFCFPSNSTTAIVYDTVY